MKNLYILLSFFFAGGVLAQTDLQNANWTISQNSRMNFNNNNLQIDISNINAANNQAAASVSDQNGNLLFYTDGLTVWESNNLIMQNGTGLMGVGGDFTQNVLIIPNPANSNRFYIITVSTGQGTNQKHGLRFTEVDLTNGLGVVLNSLNTPLPDESGVLIDDVYPLNYGKITSALNSNGTDYWLIAEIGHHIYSYNVNSNGIFFTNVVNSPLPIEQYLPTNGFDSTSGEGPMKMSSGNNRLLVGYSNTTSNHGALFLSSFNNTNGNVDPDFYSFIQTDDVASNQDLYMTGAEFSPNGNRVIRFYEAYGVYSTIELAPVGNTLFWQEQQIKQLFIPFANNLQRAIDGNIYFSTSDSAANNPNFLSVVKNSDNDGIQFLFNSVNVGSLNLTFVLPPWVQWQTCEATLVTSNAINSSLNQERTHWIMARNKLNLPVVDRVVYHAGNFIELNPDFESLNNSRFVGYIEACSGNYVFKNGSNSNSDNTLNPSGALISERDFIISPNPSSNFIDLSMKSNVFSKISIGTVEGKMVLDLSIEPANFYNLDISRFASGIYIVNVICNDGKHYSQKLIKN
jgi:hypothetical protein